MMHPIAHFQKITRHRNLVCKYCIRLGLVWQGLTHDLSKYSPIEFWTGAKYYQGDRSPNDAERLDKGISYAWLHHKGRNRHHFEYWVDYVMSEDHTVHFTGQEMPIRYVAEMFCDRIAACRVYLGDQYTDAAAYQYYLRGKDHLPMHPKTRTELEAMLITLRDEGEDAAFRYVRERLRKAKR